jgi:thioredoxin 1
MMAPAVDQLAANYTGRALVAKLDTDASQRTANSFGIRGIPTVIVFRDGKEVVRQSGAIPYSTLAALLQRASLD